MRGSVGLLERGSALRWIDRILDHASGGSGQALLLEGHAGMGKTRLHEAALDAARTRELRVLRAAGAELERAIAFGVAAQLVRVQLGELTQGRRRSLLSALPEGVRAFAQGSELPQPSGGGDLSLSHGLFTLLATAEGGRPALIAIDDLQWCDVPSLEFVLYLLHRLDELPIAIMLTARLGNFDQSSAVLDRIAAHPRVAVERLLPLGFAAVSERVAEVLGTRGDERVVEACLEATAGNPFYLHELLMALEEEKTLSSDGLAQHARALAPDAVARIVRVRVGRLGHDAAALARAVAILGDDAPLRHAAGLAGLRFGPASDAADALGADEILLAREPLRFVHPLVQHAIARDIPPAERANRHLEAAGLLYADGEPPERVAAHLLHGRAQGDEWAVAQLQAAAREAAGRSAPQSAAAYLRRALEEPPAPARRAEVLAELGRMEAAAGMPSAAKHLELAARATEDPRERAELALERGRALDAQGLHEQAALAFEDGLKELEKGAAADGHQALHDQLQAGFMASATLVPALLARLIEQSAELLEQVPSGPRNQGQRLVLAQSAMQASLSGRPAQLVAELAERAWDHGRLLAEAAPQRVGWRVAGTALCLAGELERSVEIAEKAVEDAQRSALPLAFATASFARAVPQLWQGKVDAALADLEAALDARRYGWHQFSRTALAQYALCLVEKGEPDRAEKVLLEDAPPQEVRDLEDALRLFALGAIRLAQDRPREALELALAAGDNVERTVEFYGFCPWRTAAAQAALALGDRERALELARDATDRAEQIGVLHERIRTLRVLGLCQRGDEQLATLGTAAELGKDGPPRLETIWALVELGAAMRRNNQRLEAREPLVLAADMARGGGALVVYHRARIELRASGARPRRDVLLSGPASLTPSERRIAELAALGKGNREIAQGLFVTPKTVEYHLRNVYRKLDIARRGELARALIR